MGTRQLLSCYKVDGNVYHSVIQEESLGVYGFMGIGYFKYFPRIYTLMVWNPHILELDGCAQVAHLSALLIANNFMGRLWDEVIYVLSGFQVGVLWAG